MTRADRPAAIGLSSVGAERFDASAAIGGRRGAAESALPTLVFVVIMAVRPTALVPALVASLAVSAVALVARLAQRQGLTQVLGGAVLVLVSAAWAWRSGRASNFYASGLVINAVWLVACLGSVAVRWPLVGVLMGLWEASAGEPDADDETPERSQGGLGAVGPRPSWSAWRTDPAQARRRRGYVLGTLVLAAMFALRLVVELPLYLGGDATVSALGVARLALGLPLFALTCWFVWLLVRRGSADAV